MLSQSFEDMCRAVKNFSCPTHKFPDEAEQEDTLLVLALILYINVLFTV